MVFTTEWFLEVAIESWPEWNLNRRPLNFVQMLQPTELSGHEFNSVSEPTFNFMSLFSVHVYAHLCYIYYINQYIYIYANLHSQTTPSWYTYIHTHTHTDTHTHTNTHTHIYIYIYMCICPNYIGWLMFLDVEMFNTLVFTRVSNMYSKLPPPPLPLSVLAPTCKWDRREVGKLWELFVNSETPSRSVM